MRKLGAYEIKPPCVYIMARKSHGALYTGVWIPARAGVSVLIVKDLGEGLGLGRLWGG